MSDIKKNLKNTGDLIKALKSSQPSTYKKVITHYMVERFVFDAAIAEIDRLRQQLEASEARVKELEQESKILAADDIRIKIIRGTVDEVIHCAEHGYSLEWVIGCLKGLKEVYDRKVAAREERTNEGH